MYQNNNFTARKILFNIAGGKDLGMFEVDKISKMITVQNPKAKIIFGISKNSKYKNKIKVTILMVGLPIVKESVILKALEIEKKVKVAEKLKRLKSNNKKDKSVRVIEKMEGETSLLNISPPIFRNIPIVVEDSIKSSVIEVSGNQKKTIRRTALDIKKIQEMEANEKSQQEKEWEIPTFLRKVNRIK